MMNATEMNNKKAYITPTVEIARIAVEEVITASPVKKVELKDWDYDNDMSNPQNNADVWLNM